MPQYLKDEVQQRIAAAALEVFAQKGFRGATMADIARGAGVSTGNIYRYYENKEILFYDLISDEFVGALMGLLRQRVASLAGVADVRELPAGAAFYAVSEELLRFTIENRLRVVILLGNAQGTRFEGVAEETAQMLGGLAVAHFEGLGGGVCVSEVMRGNLALIYRNFLGGLVRILTRFEGEREIREAVEGFSKYHLAGLKGFFE